MPDLNVKCTKTIELCLTGDTEDIFNFLDNNSQDDIIKMCNERSISYKTNETFEICSENKTGDAAFSV